MEKGNYLWIWLIFLADNTSWVTELKDIDGGIWKTYGLKE